MPADWQSVPLGDLVEIRHGFAFKGEFFSEKPTGDVLVTPGNFAIGGGFDPLKTKFYEGPVDPRFVLAAGDLLITMTDLSRGSDTLGSPALVPAVHGTRYLHNQRVGRVSLREGGRAVKGYLYAALRTHAYRSRVVATATGTTVKHTSPTRISAVVLPLPPVPEQQAVVSVLGALDDKIESNRLLVAAQVAVRTSEFNRLYRGHGEREALNTIAGQHKVTVRPSKTPFELFEQFSIPAFDAGGDPDVCLGTAMASGKTQLPSEPVVLFSKLNPRTPRVWNPVASGACRGPEHQSAPRNSLSSSRLARPRMPGSMRASGTTNGSTARCWLGSRALRVAARE
jgi:hypothetical protein